MSRNNSGIAPVTGASPGIGAAATARSMGNVKWKDVPTRTIHVGRVAFAYRELGPVPGTEASSSTTGLMCPRCWASSPADLNR